MDRSTPGFPVHHQLPELAQTHVHPVSDAIQLSHPLSSPSPPAFNLFQHQGLFQWVSSSHQVAKVFGVFKNYLKKSSWGNSLAGQWLELHTHHRGHGFDPWLGEKDPTSHIAESQKKKKSSSKYPTLLHQPNPHNLAWAISSWHSVSKQHWLPASVLKIYVLNRTLIKQNLLLQKGLKGQGIQELSSSRTNATLLRFEEVFKHGHQGALKWFSSTPVCEGNQNEVSCCLSSCGQLCALSC